MGRRAVHLLPVRRYGVLHIADELNSLLKANFQNHHCRKLVTTLYLQRVSVIVV